MIEVHWTWLIVGVLWIGVGGAAWKLADGEGDYDFFSPLLAGLLIAVGLLATLLIGGVYWW